VCSSDLSQYRFIKAIAAAQTSPQLLDAEYAAVFGSILNSEGQKVSLEAFLMETATGLAGIPVTVSGVIAA
jgi:hypothetical protein